MAKSTVSIRTGFVTPDSFEVCWEFDNEGFPYTWVNVKREAVVNDEMDSLIETDMTYAQAVDHTADMLGILLSDRQWGMIRVVSVNVSDGTGRNFYATGTEDIHDAIKGITALKNRL